MRGWPKQAKGLKDLDVLVAIGKGSWLLKLNKLRALGFIKGRIAELELTEDGVSEIHRLSEVSKRAKKGNS